MRAGPLALGLVERALLARLQNQPLLLVAVALDCSRHRIGDGRQQVEDEWREGRGLEAPMAATSRSPAASGCPTKAVSPGRAASRGTWDVPNASTARTSEASGSPGPPAQATSCGLCRVPPRPDPTAAPSSSARTASAHRASCASNPRLLVRAVPTSARSRARGGALRRSSAWARVAARIAPISVGRQVHEISVRRIERAPRAGSDHQERWNSGPPQRHARQRGDSAPPRPHPADDRTFRAV